MSSYLLCLPHSPILMCYAEEPPEHEAIQAAYAQQAEAVRAFDPELVILFGTDHYSGFHLDRMPATCIGLSCQAVDDIGGFPGPFDVPHEEALALIDHVRAHGFDPAVSHTMTVDHGFSQPAHRILGALDAYPVIPVFINVMTPPLQRFARSRRFGQAIGSAPILKGKRVLLMGSGGMSHHPTRYFPLVGEADDAVTRWQLAGERGGTFTEAEWLDRLRVMHLEGAVMLADGSRTREDICLNPTFDRYFLDVLINGNLDSFDAWEPEDVMAEAGVGSLELHTWIAAAAAHAESGGARPHTAIYADTLEYGIGFGMVCGAPA